MSEGILSLVIETSGGGMLLIPSLIIYNVLCFIFTNEIADNLFIWGYTIFTVITMIAAISIWDTFILHVWLGYSLFGFLFLKLQDEQRKIDEDKTYVSSFCIIGLIIVAIFWFYVKVNFN